MRAESLNTLTAPKESSYQQNFSFDISGPSQDPTFEQGTQNIFSPKVQDAISKLDKKDFKIFSLKYGLEDGVKVKTQFISEEMKISVDDVDKTLKRVKKLLFKNLSHK